MIALRTQPKSLLNIAFEGLFAIWNEILRRLIFAITFYQWNRECFDEVNEC